MPAVQSLRPISAGAIPPLETLWVRAGRGPAWGPCESSFSWAVCGH